MNFAKAIGGIICGVAIGCIFGTGIGGIVVALAAIFLFSKTSENGVKSLVFLVLMMSLSVTAYANYTKEDHQLINRCYQYVRVICSGSNALNDKACRSSIKYTFLLNKKEGKQKSFLAEWGCPKKVIEGAIPPHDSHVKVYKKKNKRYQSRLKRKYDRFTKETVFIIPPETSKKFSLYVFYSHKKLTFGFRSTSESWEFLRCHHLSILHDGKLLKKLADTNHDGSVGDGYVLEYIDLRLTLRDLRKLINAKIVEAKLCNTEYKLSKSDMLSLKELSNYIFKN